MTFARAARLAGRMAPAAGLAAMTLALGACDRMGNPFEALGAGIPPPDEFQVIEYEPLVIPETYDLPEPRPGAPSPRAPDPDSAAMAAILGPGAVRAAAATETSAGEEVLLSSADAASASREIRVQLEEDRVAAETDEEYQPPTVLELLGLSGGDDEDIDESELIDPVAEAERLRTEGVATPVDPDAAARAEEEEEPETEPVVIDRRPTNRIGPAPEPRF